MTNAYSCEWNRYFSGSDYRRSLKNHAINGNLRNSHFRSVCWKLFLEILPVDQGQWVAKMRGLRGSYAKMKDEFITNPRNYDDSEDISLHNPLSQNTESPWNRFFQDNELRVIIKQDVIRTFPEIEFFKSSEVQSIMMNALFIFSRTHKALSYQQGMHELLAPIIFVLHCDHESFLHASSLESIDETFKEMMDPTYLEHDAYYMFSQVMETVEPWYIANNTSPGIVRPKPTPTQPFLRSPDLNPSNAIVSKLTRIHEYLLKKHDMELHNHLEKLDILPQIYGIRWVRLLFGREFPMQDLLALWDALFSDGVGFDLIDYIFVAMLLYIRDLLLTSDYPTCLTTLMHYPPATDVQFFVEKALWLREPNAYPRPPNYTYQTLNSGARGLTDAPTKSSTLSILRRKSSSMSAKIRPRHLPVASSNDMNHLPVTNSNLTKPPPMTKSSSVPMNLQTDISPGVLPFTDFSQPIRQRQTQSAQASAASSPVTTLLDLSNSSRATTPSTEPRELSPISKKTNTRVERELTRQNAILLRQVAEQSEVRTYCSQKLGQHIDKLQTMLLGDPLYTVDQMFVVLAGIKQVRDILNETLSYSSNMFDDDTRTINHEIAPSNTPPLEHNPQNHTNSETTTSSKKPSRFLQMRKKSVSNKLDDVPRTTSKFYADTSIPPSMTAGRVYELIDKRKDVSVNGQTQNHDDDIEVSPNPLYRPYSADDT